MAVDKPAATEVRNAVQAAFGVLIPCTPSAKDCITQALIEGGFDSTVQHIDAAKWASVLAAAKGVAARIILNKSRLIHTRQL